ncbi:Dynein heavy chain 2, axonemal [Desmophyllum pertusum]|uniref:Dynein heavy chain 2, axonemal n=1 Tax=Desmophyllum pertusum TaxID=174260 RepID=A0A9W9YWV6_9CNID|nr:Dynein heavy chain 2, axonemal [Desmophyllum pertusum]
MTYMIRFENAVLNPDNIEQKLQLGTIRTNHIESLLRTMTNVYAPLFFGNRSWPDSIKNDFSAQLHKFMANLTDTRYKMQGKTVLYVPNEGTKLSIDEAAKSKEFVQRLETAMIHWTRQIKEVLSSQDTFEAAENSGPLEEIEFWRSRCADLSGISEQLDKPGVKRIQSILEHSKSSYVAPFLKLSKLIQDGSAQAQSNLKFLSTLKEPCEELAQAQPKDIPAMLPKILNIIRIIWMNSEHYKSRERLTGLLRKVSNEIIKRCSTKSHWRTSLRVGSRQVCKGYRRVSSAVSHGNTRTARLSLFFLQISRMHSKLSSERWILDQSSIFAQVDAFVQRCKDLLEVCEGQIHFARMYDGEKRPLPCFHGVRGPEVVRSLLEIEATFEKNLQILKDVKKNYFGCQGKQGHSLPPCIICQATTWHDDYNRFRAGVKDLEVMVQNLMSSAFETIITVQEGVEILDIFQHLSSREAIRRTIDKKNSGGVPAVQ